MMQAMSAIRVNPGGELSEAVTLDVVGDALNRLDRFQPTASDQRDAEQQGWQPKGQFLIDRDGRIRWLNIETGDPAHIGKFPTYEELAAAAQLYAEL
jgi:hypothetical protein